MEPKSQLGRIRWEECFRPSFGGCSAWPGACSEVNKISVVDIELGGGERK